MKINKLKSKPSYELYIQLWYTLDAYLMTRIDYYIFFEYYEWSLPLSILIKPTQMNINKKDIYILKKIMEYDYEVFKVLLYLYWDLEYYMEGINNVKNSLIVDSIDFLFLRITFSNKIKKLKDHLKTNNDKNSNYFWANIEIYGLLDKIFKYDYFLNYDLKNKYINYIKEYKKFNNKIGYNELAAVRLRLYRFNKENKINSLYYESYIDKWYKEWILELNEKKTSKYKKKIKKLDLLLKNLMKIFKNNNN